MYHEHLQPHIPSRFISDFSQERLQTCLTFGYVLDVIISYSSASPRLLCGTACYNHCQYLHCHHISHILPTTHYLSHIVGHLHI